MNSDILRPMQSTICINFNGLFLNSVNGTFTVSRSKVGLKTFLLHSPSET